jgi:hypothetical protein
MKIRVVLLAFMCLFTTRCATYYHMFSFNDPKSHFYSEQEKVILEKTVKSIEFDYGYDPELDLDYVVPLTQGFTDFKAGEKELARALEGVDGVTLADYNETIYRLKKTTFMKMEKYREDGNWKNYTFISKYLIPPLDHYYGLIEKQTLKKNKAYLYEIDDKKKTMDDRINYDIRRKEFDDLWKNDYN